MEWKRTINFNSKISNVEQWIYKDNNDLKRFDVDVIFGKPIDIVKLKERMLSDFELEIEKIKTSRSKLYKETEEKILECPVCSGEEQERVLRVYNAHYVKCKNCNHYYISNRPTKEQLEEFYAKNTQYQSTYADKESLLTRVDQVALPKLNYVIQQYEKQYGKKPKSILDVGAGSGHFVYAARNEGIRADGIEISQYGCQFAKINFGIDLYDTDFIDCCNEFKDYDIVTFWGVIEHTPYPMDMINAARKITCGRQTLIVVEVPRWESLSTSIQSTSPNTVIRHLDPLGHINCFTDSSLSTAFVKAGVDITAAWYFGMDTYELISQFAYLNKNEKFVENTKHFISQLQEYIDKARLSDSMVIVGVPNKD